jgi:DNA-binding CsgD family transcriptional regulator
MRHAYARWWPRVAALHAAGHGAGCIARRLRVPRSTVRTWLGRAGLACNGWCPCARAAEAARLRRTLAAQGFKHLAAWRDQARRLACARRGWIEAETPREADVLDVLRDGPRRPAGVAAVLGLSRRQARYHLRRLRARGAVVRPAYGVYALAPGVGRGRRRSSDKETGRQGDREADGRGAGCLLKAEEG